MKTLFTVILFSLISFGLKAQDGFDLIRKAERKIERGNLRKASLLLEEAEKSDYGFCGNAWFDARNAILKNKAEIAAVSGDTMRAIDILSDTSEVLPLEPISLFRYIFQFEQKESVRSELRQAILSYTSLEKFTFYFEVKFSFRQTSVFLRSIEFQELFHNLSLNEDETVKEILVDEFLSSEYAGGILK